MLDPLQTRAEARGYINYLKKPGLQNFFKKFAVTKALKKLLLLDLKKLSIRIIVKDYPNYNADRNFVYV